MPPVTFNQLVKNEKANPQKFQQDRLQLMQLSKTLFSASEKLKRGDKADRAIGTNIAKFSNYLETLAQAPLRPENRQRIDEALTGVFDMEPYLFGEANSEGLDSVYFRLYDVPGVKEKDLDDQMIALNNFGNFGMDITALTAGRIKKSDPKSPGEYQKYLDEREKKRQEWNTLRDQEKAEYDAKVQEEAEKKAQALAEEQAELEHIRKRNEERQKSAAAVQAMKDKMNAILHDERNEEKEQEDQKEDLKEDQKEEKKEPIIQNDQNIRNDDSHLIDDDDNSVLDQAVPIDAKTRKQLNLQKSMQESIDKLMVQARDTQRTDFERAAILAEAVAYKRELDNTELDGSVKTDVNWINRQMTDAFNGFTIQYALKTGGINDLANQSINDLVKAVQQTENDAYLCPFGKEGDGERAESIFHQMVRTWRFAGNSDEFKRARDAIQEYSERETVNEDDVVVKRIPTRNDNYVAGRFMQDYVTKNLGAAKSAVGKTRMACALAFIKQTMTDDGFRAYCKGLNQLRGISYTIVGPGDIKYNNDDPRCIDPDEIGTVKEVYNTARERIHKLAQVNGTPTARELAILTALENIKNRSRDGEDTVVEHEELVKEIQKVQADRRFQNVMRMQPDEMRAMAFDGNLKTMDGYTQGLKPHQIEQLEKERAQAAQEEKERQDELDRQAEEEKRKREEEETRKANERKRLEEEAQQRLAEQERKRQEEEAQKKLEEEQRIFNEQNPRFLDLMEEMVPRLDALEKINRYNLNDVFKGADPERAKKLDEQTELAARLVAVWEFQKREKAKGIADADMRFSKAELENRIQELKQDKDIQDYGEFLLDNPKVTGIIKGLKKKAEELGKPEPEEPKKPHKIGEKLPPEQPKKKREPLSPYAQKLYPVISMAGRFQRDYQQQKNPKPVKPFTVGDGYKEMAEHCEPVLNMKVDYMKAVGALAAMVAMREAELKNGGLDAPLDVKAYKKRTNEIKKDKLMTKVSQTMRGPKRLAEIADIAKQPNPYQALSAYTYNLYQQMKLELNPEKNQQQKQPDQPGAQAEPQPEAPKQQEAPAEQQPVQPEKINQPIV